MEPRIHFGRAAALALLGLGLLALLPRIGTAQSGLSDTTTELKKLITRVDDLQKKVVDHANQIATLQRIVTDQTTKLAILEPFSRKGDTVTLTGVNLQIRNGRPRTDQVDGTGNLIVGHNESATGGGSHNLVIGIGHTYRAYGGLVAGSFNTIQGDQSSVTGGRNNVAEGQNSSVSGGQNNRAIGNYSSVTAGLENIAKLEYASVSGGANNQAGGRASSICGGQNRNHQGELDWAAGTAGKGFYNGSPFFFSSGK